VPDRETGRVFALRFKVFGGAGEAAVAAVDEGDMLAALEVENQAGQQRRVRAVQAEYHCMLLFHHAQHCFNFVRLRDVAVEQDARRVVEAPIASVVAQFDAARTGRCSRFRGNCRRHRYG